MKILVEPKRLKRMLENILICKGTAELEAVIGQCGPEGIEFEDISLDVVVVKARYSKGFFLEYETTGTDKEPELVPLSKYLLSALKEGFDDETVEVWTDDTQIYIKGRADEYKEPLTDAEVEPLPMPFKTHRTMGFLPEELEPKVQVLVKSEYLTQIPKAENINLLAYENGEIHLTVEGVGLFDRRIQPSYTKKIKPLQMEFGTKYLTKLGSQFVGEVWMTLRPDAAVFSQKNKDFLLTYMLSSAD